MQSSTVRVRADECWGWFVRVGVDKGIGDWDKDTVMGEGYRG